MTFDPEQAVKDPSAYYDTPQAVLDDTRLDVDQKRKILQAMEQDALALLRAAGENMAGGEAAALEKVRAALRSLDDRQS